MSRLFIAGLFFISCSSFIHLGSSAQAPGIAEFYQASSEIKRYYFSLSDLAFVIGAITGILGGLRVFSNWQGGRHHIDRQVTGWLFSCIFLSLCGIFLKGLFGL